MIKKKYIYVGLGILCLQSITAFADPKVPSMIVNVINNMQTAYQLGPISYGSQSGVAPTSVNNLANPINYKQPSNITVNSTSNQLGDRFSVQFAYSVKNSNQVSLGCSFWAECYIQKQIVNNVDTYVCALNSGTATATQLSSGSENPKCTVVGQPYYDSNLTMVLNVQMDPQ